MKRLLILALFLHLGSGTPAAQVPDLAGAYYHYSLASLHELREEYTAAIAEFETAVSLDTDSAPLRVDFATALWKAGQVERAIEQAGLASEMDTGNAAPHYLLGLIYSTLGNRGQPELLDKAVDELSRAVELDPEHREALYDLGRLFFSRREYQGSIEALGRLIDLMPWIVPAYELKARAHMELNQDEQAISVLEKALEYDNRYVDTFRLLGSLYEKTGQAQRAIALYTDAADQVNDAGILFSLASLLVEQKEFKRGIPLLRSLAESYPDNIRFTFTLIKALREYKKFSDAAQILERVLESNPTHYGLNLELAEILALLGETDRAEKLFLNLRERSDTDDKRQAVDTNLALLYQQEGRFQDAVALLQKLRSENPDDQFTGLRLIYALRDAGEYSEALDLADEIMEQRAGIDPDQPPKLAYLIIARAQVLSALDQTDRAITLIKEHLSDGTEAINLYLTGSVIYSSHQRFQEAENIIRDALEHYPDNERLEFQLGAIYEEQDQLESVEEIFTGILKKNPDHAGVLNYLGYMLADRGIRLLEALEYIQKAVDIEPHNGAFLDSLGWVYFKLGQMEKAEQNLLEAARLNRSDPTIHDHLGDLYRRLGEYDQARTYYQKSVQFAEEEELKRVKKKLAELENKLSDRDR